MLNWVAIFHLNIELNPTAVVDFSFAYLFPFSPSTDLNVFPCTAEGKEHPALYRSGVFAPSRALVGHSASRVAGAAAIRLGNIRSGHIIAAL